MKAYICDIINRVQRSSDTLDIKAILCNKTWRSFSETIEKEIHIFMEDGSLVISKNGDVEMGKWFYVPANRSLVISSSGQNFLVHPIICNNVLALVQDGTNMCSFLLDDTIKELEGVRSLQSISSYVKSNLNKLPSGMNVNTIIPSISNEKVSKALPLISPGQAFNPNGKYRVKFDALNGGDRTSFISRTAGDELYCTYYYHDFKFNGWLEGDHWEVQFKDGLIEIITTYYLRDFSTADIITLNQTTKSYRTEHHDCLQSGMGAVGDLLTFRWKDMLKYRQAELSTVRSLLSLIKIKSRTD